MILGFSDPAKELTMEMMLSNSLPKTSLHPSLSILMPISPACWFFHSPLEIAYYIIGIKIGNKNFTPNSGPILPKVSIAIIEGCY